jgi:FKBP-type peptidyl-prolyl cis-trans isomerase
LLSPKQYWRSTLDSLKKLFALPHARELENKLTEVRNENQSLQLEFQGVLSELQDTRSREEERHANFHQRLIDVETARDAARQQVEALEHNLAEASTRLDSAEARVNVLNRQLEEEDREHQLEMEDVRSRANKLERRQKWVMMFVISAFLVAGLSGITQFRDVRNNAVLLADMSQDLKDIKVSMMQQIGKLQESSGHHPPVPTIGLPGKGAITETPAMSSDTEQARAAQPEEKSQGERTTDLQTPGYLSSSDQSHRISMRPTREEMQAFFKENSLKPDVISLPSGLQYKILRQGNGHSPVAADKVVIDYRGFLSDGTEFDSSYRESEPATFVVDELNPGLKEALLKMKEGAQWELYIPPSLAHKGGTRKRGVTGYEPQFYVVKLISIIQTTGEDKT